MRRRYVVSYDISSDKRRTKVFKLLMGYGDHVQFSVFIADLTHRELVMLRGLMLSLINEREDQIMLVDLGKETRELSESLEVLGKPYTPTQKSMVV